MDPNRTGRRTSGGLDIGDSPLEMFALFIGGGVIVVPLVLGLVDELRAQALSWLIGHGLAVAHHPLIAVPGFDGAGLTLRGAAAVVGVIALVIASSWVGYSHRATREEEF